MAIMKDTSIFSRHFLHYRTLNRDIKKEFDCFKRWDMKIGDFGVGDGRYTHIFEGYNYEAYDKHPKDWDVFELDLCGEIREEMFCEFDFILCSQVLEHVPQLEGAF